METSEVGLRIDDWAAVWMEGQVKDMFLKRERERERELVS